MTACDQALEAALYALDFTKVWAITATCTTVLCYLLLRFQTRGPRA